MTRRFATLLCPLLLLPASPAMPSAWAQPTTGPDDLRPGPADVTDELRTLLRNTAASTARQSIDRGLAFLEKQKQPDGSWQADPRVPPAVTALALRAFVNAPGRSPDDPLVKKGYDALLARQVADGGIYDDLLANYNTAIAVSALTAANKAAGDGRYDEQIERAVNYLRRLQWTEQTVPQYAEDKPGEVGTVAGENDPFYGGWGYGGRSRGAGRPDLSNAQMALEALRDAGVPSDDPAFQRAVTFITRLQNNSETNPNAWAGDDGGFVYSPGGDKTYESMAGETTTPDGQRRLRSYGSMTYAGLKSMIYAGLGKDDPRVRAAFDWITDNWTLDANPGMESAGEGESGLYYYYLTLARALDAYDVPRFEVAGGREVDWRLALIDKLAEVQNEDGSWVGEARWRESDPTMVTAYAVIALEAALRDLDENP